MKGADIRNQTVAEIEQTLRTLKEQLFKLRAEAVSGRIERPSRIGDTRRDIARCNTILKEKKSET